MDGQLIRFTLKGDTVQSSVLQIYPQLSPTPKNEWATSLTVLNDGGFLVSGYTDYVGATTHQQDAMHLRTDNNFIQRLNVSGWAPTTGQGAYNKVAKAFQTPKDTIYAFGSTDGPSLKSIDLDLWAFKLDSKGVQRGVSNYVMNNSEETMTSALKATLGGYLLTGVSVDNTSKLFTIKIIKIRFDDLNFDPNATPNDIQFSYSSKQLGKGQT